MSKNLIYIFTFIILILNIFSSNVTGGGVWWRVPGKDYDIIAGETIEIETDVYNDYLFDMNVTLTIYNNGSDEIDSYYINTTGWYAGLNETNFILEPGELKVVLLWITAPITAECAEIYNVYLECYAESTFSSKINETNDRSTSVKVKCDDIIYFDISEGEPNNNSPISPDPNNSNNLTAPNPESISNLLYFGMIVSVVIIVFSIGAYFRFKKKNPKP